MRYSEFWSLVDDVYGEGYGRTLVGTQVLTELGSRTAQAALDAGVEPRTVWHALCDAMDVPDSARWGSDRYRQAPPR
ncbi:DUF3046 domain-containing protein [Luteimicrobium subarcticum]|uniref:DUF3046 family protein n=1 Tax=Luteimicrobium subarcticum TaxID=620910 RepID=A0A2M8WTW1_9MICO|nr:DUF3046 domain-containing protein [Luteimicrobium subarcticum]PJI94381.1 Protein of unknown function (DUF3046) [Luteimicrobium subarcticum]